MPGKRRDLGELLQELRRGDAGAELDRVERHAGRALARERRLLAVDGLRDPPRADGDRADALDRASRLEARAAGAAGGVSPQRSRSSSTVAASPRAIARSAQSARAGRNAVSARRWAITSAGSPSSAAARQSARSERPTAVRGKRQVRLERRRDAHLAHDGREQGSVG